MALAPEQSRVLEAGHRLADTKLDHDAAPRFAGRVGSARRRRRDNYNRNLIGICAYPLYDEGTGRATRSDRTGGSDGTTVVDGWVDRRARGGSAGDGRRGAKIRRHTDLHDPGGLAAEL